MYEPLLFIHSTVRWIVLVAGFYGIWKFANLWLKNKEWTEADSSFIWAYTQAYGIQIALGLTLLIGISPIPKSVLGNWQLLENPFFQFWAVYHPLMMLSSIIVFSVIKERADKGPKEKRAKRMFFALSISMLMVLLAVPWPGLIYGRPLFRLSF